MTYVWFDALLNYMTAVGYGGTPTRRAPSWPTAGPRSTTWWARHHPLPLRHLAGHAHGLGEPCPSTSLPTAALTVRNAETGKAEKMSKSRGNAIAPQDVVDLLGVEGYRYYFMTDVAHGEDSAISFERMEQVYNADLANSWGQPGLPAPST